MSAVRTERTAHPAPLGGVSAGQMVFVVKSRIELSTFRFSEALLPLEPSGTANRVSPAYPHNGWSELTKPILAAVPPYTG